MTKDQWPPQEPYINSRRLSIMPDKARLRTMLAIIDKTPDGTIVSDIVFWHDLRTLHATAGAPHSGQPITREACREVVTKALDAEA